MIRNVRVENYKSISTLALDLGRITVLIGANGSGKSNILEAIALASAAAQNKLDNEFLISRGIRVTETRFMRSAFGKPAPRIAIQISFEKDKGAAIEKILASSASIKVSVEGDDKVAFDCELFADEAASYPKWSTVPDTRAVALPPLWRRRISPRKLKYRLKSSIVCLLNSSRVCAAGRRARFPDSSCTRPRTPRSALFRPRDRSSRSESGAKVCSLT